MIILILAIIVIDLILTSFLCLKYKIKFWQLKKLLIAWKKEFGF